MTMERKTFISELVGEAYPIAVALDGGRLRRNWIARTVDVLPDEATLGKLQRFFEDEAIASIRTAYSSSVTAEAISAALPSVQLVRLDDRHLIVRTEFAGPDLAVGSSAVISQLEVLQAVDHQIRLDDLQGLPWDFWFFLRLGREQGSA
jgi:hypothetical protein